MSRPTLEVADVFRRHGAEYRHVHGATLSRDQRRVMRAIELCRTVALGGHRDRCDRCGHERISYNSCRNRHCPKCQFLAKAKWLEARQSELLPVEYFHVVFTVPEVIARIALQNKRVVYAILFRAASETLRTIAADRKHLGAKIGFLAVLHTWGQNLMHHPHLHCVVPGGGISIDGSRWVGCRRGFFLPVRVLSRMFRGKFLAHLREAFEAGKLQFFGALSSLAEPERFASFLRLARKTEWVVYSKRPFGGPTQVLRYLGRYTHRIAISNDRIIAVEEGKVTFRWKDYRRGNRVGAMTLDASEFIRRFLLHALPGGFKRLRHYGFLANSDRARNLARCRQLLIDPLPAPAEPPSPPTCRAFTAESLDTCPRCHLGRMLRTETFTPAVGHKPLWIDSS